MVEKYFGKNKLQRNDMDKLVRKLQKFDEELGNSKLKPSF